MESSHEVTKRLLSNISDEEEEEAIEDKTKRTVIGYWQRRKEAWRKRKKRRSNPCCLGFACLVWLWSVLALITTLLSYFRLSKLLEEIPFLDGHKNYR